MTQFANLSNLPSKRKNTYDWIETLSEKEIEMLHYALKNSRLRDVFHRIRSFKENPYPCSESSLRNYKRRIMSNGTL